MAGLEPDCMIPCDRSCSCRPSTTDTIDMTEDAEFYRRAIAAVSSANTEGVLQHERRALAEKVLSGYSGRKLVGALQRLCRLFDGDETACYLEIGVFQGLTLNSVASANRVFPCYGVDNFAYFDPRQENMSLVKERMAALGIDNAELINADYEDALSSLDRYLGGAQNRHLFHRWPARLSQSAHVSRTRFAPLA